MTERIIEGAAPVSDTSSLAAGIAGRARGPGGLYNLGNLIALVGGFSGYVVTSGAERGLLALLVEYLFGSVGTGCLTVAIVVFLISGEAYHRAWRHGAPPILRLNRLGDLLSAIAAVILTFALVSFGETTLAVAAGALLAFGKIGTALLPERSSEALTSGFRLMVVASRVPSLGALGISLFVYATAGGDSVAATMALVMFVSYLFWLAADCLLMWPPAAVVPTEV